MEKEFNEAIEKLSELYEHGKDHLHALNGDGVENNHTEDLYRILRDMRDLAATTMQKLYWTHPN